MPNVWVLASLWVGLALVATLLAIWFKISTALTEIVVGTVAQLVIGAIVGPMGLAAKTEWITFLAGTGAIVLTFLAGAELDPVMTDNRIIVADRMNGKPLDPKEGPFKIVVPGDKRPARWIRMLTALQVENAVSPSESSPR